MENEEVWDQESLGIILLIGCIGLTSSLLE